MLIDDLPAGPPAGDRTTTFLADPVTDHLLRAVVTLTMELSVTRERLFALETVLADGRDPVAARIEALAPTPESDAARRTERERLIRSVLGPLVGKLADAA
jgi:hypothetical protein